MITFALSLGFTLEHLGKAFSSNQGPSSYSWVCALGFPSKS